MLGVYFHDSPTSLFRFVGEDGKKLPPARVQHPLGEPGAGQAGDVQVFVDNRAIFVDKPPCYFVVEVFALVGDFAVQLGHLLFDLTIAAFPLLPGQAALGAGKSGLGLLKVPGGFDHLPFRGDEEVGVGAQVYPNRCPVFG